MWPALLAGVTFLLATCSPSGLESWSSTGELETGRVALTATLLTDGRVLVVGGGNVDLNEIYASAEIYDPDLGTWSPTGSMAIPRAGHTATLLNDGRVLVAGGGREGQDAQAELYDPSTGSWNPTGTMTVARNDFRAVLLGDGRVLVVGGDAPDANRTTAELYDPLTETWSQRGGLLSHRSDFSATLLPGGEVLVAGGVYRGESLAEAELFDPRTGTSHTTGRVIDLRSDHQATLLASGGVLISGGISQADCCDLLETAEIYDQETGTWATVAPMTSRRDGHTATLLTSGTVLVAGGIAVAHLEPPVDSSEIYDPEAGAWVKIGNLPQGRFLHTATMLGDGRVLVAGGFGGDAGSPGYLTTVATYDPAAGQ
jgi:N-acetylneuraminic acid mutarotase